ncbi:hypothetical protein [Companilactobacillus mishanensis]|uniref:CAP domain-containing protein n=1 Tax=Companilactobacillus mishanensis TaxID=2486008 RepID=A0A5P0ZHR1_9LACO|nr:hypothetical protein [Companilactobacillus mishanensis]MQS52518.1 CAP domain-containing protein [Companilactobacillus mishanensis]
MKRNKQLFKSALLIALLALAVPTTVVNAATAPTNISESSVAQSTADTNATTSYTTSELNAAKAYQATYQKLVASDSPTSIYDTTPVLTGSFEPGVMNKSAISQIVSWINYYRSLSSLPAVTENATTDRPAQISASVMAAAQSTPYLPQHGLKNTTKPDNVSDLTWNQAVYGSTYSNLYFGFPTSLGSPIRELMLDNTNTEGLNAGHRGWFLSPFLTSVGVGSATSSTGRLYENIFVVNPMDGYRVATNHVVTYPGSGMFPVEELQADNGTTQIPWSIAFATQKDIVNGTTSITVENLSDGTKGTVEPSYNGNGGYCNTLVTFLPPATLTVNSHSQYRVTISGLSSETTPSFTYTFKTFSEKGSGVDGTVIDNASTATDATTETAQNVINTK